MSKTMFGIVQKARVFVGKVKNEIQISNIKWSPSEKIKIGDPIEISGEVKGALEGDTAKIDVIQLYSNGVERLISRFESKVLSNKLDATWFFAPEKTISTPSVESEKQSAVERYFFRFECEEVIEKSGNLEFKLTQNGEYEISSRKSNSEVREQLESDNQPSQQPSASSVKSTKGYKIKYGKDYLVNGNGYSLNDELLSNLTSLCEHLLENNLVNGDITFSQGVRLRVVAHKWSTAYTIRNGVVPLSNLQSLSNGRDLDGNLWYQEGWTKQQIIANAEKNWKGAKAAEGYPKDDPKRLPNTGSAGVSNHIKGNAIDASIPWTIDRTGVQANGLVEKFGLSRPVSGEPWHFELAKTK